MECLLFGDTVSVNISLLAVEHCSLACEYCSTGAPFASKIYNSAESFCEWIDLLENKGILVPVLGITGGEPFLHPKVCDGSFITYLKKRYPFKSIILTTNFTWASEERIVKYAPIISKLTKLAISVYDHVLKKMGDDEFNRLVALLKYLCPDTIIELREYQHFLSWEFHEDRREVKGACCTSDCFILKPNGILSHCSLAVGAQNIPKYNEILRKTKEALLDLSQLKNKKYFSHWQKKYPLDLCFYCTMWEEKYLPHKD